MLGVDEILRELERDNEIEGLPPGFRFHPTDEELITFYLASKVFDDHGSTTFVSATAPLQIAEVDLNRCEPWELPDVAKMGEREWYFFSLRDRKYPTGLRTNRATGAGYWKATGKDREVYSSGSSGELVGMKKTLVFYRGRAPRGEKTKWVMHEYRLDGQFSCRHLNSCKEEWVICRILHKMGEKKIPSIQLQSQSYLTKPNSSFSTTITTSSNSLPPLLEYQSHNEDQQNLIQIPNQNHQNPFVISTQESDLKSLIINPLMRHCDLFSVNNNAFSLHGATSSHHQDFPLKQVSSAIAKQCKKEPTTPSTHYPIDGLVSNFNWANQKIQENNSSKYHHHHQLVPFSGFGMNNNGVTSHAIDAAAIEHVMNTEPPLGWW